MLTIAVFSARGAVAALAAARSAQFDDGLESISATASNVVEEELGERARSALAAAEMAAVVRAPDDVVQVLDASGAPILPDGAADAAAVRAPRSPAFTGVTRARCTAPMAGRGV